MSWYVSSSDKSDFDVMSVNGVEFLTTLPRKIRLVTAGNIPTQTSKQLINFLTKVLNLYARERVLVNIIIMDQEFDKIK